MTLEEGVHVLDHGNKFHTVKISFAAAVGSGLEHSPRAQEIVVRWKMLKSNY